MSKRNRPRPDAGLPAWTPFERTALPKETILQRLDHIDAIAHDFGTDQSAVRRQLDAIDREEAIWVNSRYQVNIRRVDAQEDIGWPAMVHLSVKRLDKQQMGTEWYRDWMKIKDELVGPEHEAMILLPARSREIDTSNQYHAYVFAETNKRFPVGWFEGRRIRPPAPDRRSNAVQSPFEPHHRQ